MLKSLLIANRGEIACRIIRTARRLGIRTVAVYSDADAKALHVRQADEAVHIGASPARESYLVGEKIIAAARATGAEAVHPGYGFLSENADFAQAVIDAGLVWVGPRPESIRAMGLKDAAKKLMDAAGVPTTPGYLGEDQAPERLQREADAIGYPVLIKAVAGGGGKGMRRVNASAEFADMLVSCKREAAAAFGDDRVLIEKYILSPRHIEVQVFGDTHGEVVHLFERDCSLQRRHQKVIEEAPAPGMDERTREAVCGAAVKAAKAVDYVGAGTIEFIADASEGLRADRIWFMEMNTRLQVEHPVTEEITGVDLVEWQLRVASGEALPKRQEELSIDGWAMEARLYAENPSKEFLPSIGKLEALRLPAGYARVDTGVEAGDEVSSFYDPMVAKVIVRGSDRTDALDYLWHALNGVVVWPVKTNAGLLMRLLKAPAFESGTADTNFIAAHVDEVVPADEPGQDALSTAATYFRFGGGGRHPPVIHANRIELHPDVRGSPWYANSGFRLNAARHSRVLVETSGQVYEVKPTDRLRRGTTAQLLSDSIVVAEDGLSFAFHLPRPGQVGGALVADGAIISPMPGRVIAVEVRQGEEVAAGQKLLTLEAMKMEHSLAAPFDGIVAELNAVEGGQVTEGTMLVRIDKLEA